MEYERENREDTHKVNICDHAFNYHAFYLSIHQNGYVLSITDGDNGTYSITLVSVATVSSPNQWIKTVAFEMSAGIGSVRSNSLLRTVFSVVLTSNRGVDVSCDTMKFSTCCKQKGQLPWGWTGLDLFNDKLCPSRHSSY